MGPEKGSRIAQLVSEKKILEELLSSREQILQSVVNSLTVGVVVADNEGRLILFNPSAEEILGIGLTETQPEDWVAKYGLFLSDKVTPFATEDLPLVRSLNGDTVHDVEMFIRNPNRPGGVLITVSASPLTDKMGKIQGGVAVFYDITEQKRMEEALRKSERSYADLFLGAADPIVILDRSGRIRGVNPAVERTSGYRPADLMGKHFIQAKVIAPSSLPKAVQEFTRVIAGQDARPFELEIISKKGGILFFEAHARRIHKDEKVDTIQVIFRDMTERKKSERKLAVQHAVSRVLSEGLEMNEVTLQIMQSIGETLGLDFGAIWKVDPQDGGMKCFQVWQRDAFFSSFEENAQKTSFRLGQGFPGLVWERRKTVWIADLSKETLSLNEALPASIRSGFALPVCVGGKVVGVMEFFGKHLEQPDKGMLQMLDAIGSQIGQFMERKKAEQALMLNHLELAKAQTEREQLEIFAYVASHDLKEPLQKILAYSDFIKSEIAGNLLPTTTLQSYLDKLEKAAMRMSGLTGDLMKYMKASAKTGLTDWVALAAVLDQVLKEMDDEIRAHDAKIECGPLPILKADVRQMHQLFQNLLSNSLKFRHPDRPLRVVISSREAESGYVEIMLQDNGIGFNDKFREQIFKPFEKLHAVGQYGGSGIGLAICRKIVERHRGTIQAQSREGQGTSFLLKLPLA